MDERQYAVLATAPSNQLTVAAKPSKLNPSIWAAVYHGLSIPKSIRIGLL